MQITKVDGNQDFKVILVIIPIFLWIEMTIVKPFHITSETNLGCPWSIY